MPTLDERITQVNNEIEALQVKIKEKRAELKGLINEKAEDDKQRIMDAVVANGKTVDEIIAAIGVTEL